MWLSVFFGGIWQFICNIFSWKNKTPFWRVIWATITFCIVAFTSMLGYAFYDEFVRDQRYRNYYAESLGDRYSYRNKGNGSGESYIFDKLSGEKILTGIDWIARPEDGDSLIVFAKDKKRGFFNRYSGEVSIPAKYDAAWCFNDGVAGVCLGDSVFFIDHNDRPINSLKFARIPNRNYVYHGNYYAFADKGKMGLVDKDGNIALEAIYDDITPMANKMWNVTAGEKVGAVNADGKIVVPCEYKGVLIYDEGGIVVIAEDNSKKALDYSGVVTDDFVYDFTNTLEHYSDDFDKEGNRILKAANLFSYMSNGRYGLMDKNGHPITPPIYNSISAYSANLFECQIACGGEYVMLNEKGEKVTN